MSEHLCMPYNFQVKENTEKLQKQKPLSVLSTTEKSPTAALVRKLPRF